VPLAARPLRTVAIVYDEASVRAPGEADTGAAEAAAVAAVAHVVDDVEQVARRHGLEATRVPLVSDGPAMLRQVAGITADVVVNLAESWAGSARHEAAVAWALEVRGGPYTGVGPKALALCLDKPTTRAVLAARGLPVPEGAVVADPDAGWPSGLSTSGSWIVKPVAQDASHGIDAASVVHSPEAALARVRHLASRGLGAALVERYVDGGEVNVSIVELGDAPARVLPIARIDFSRMPPGAPHILTDAGKWDAASPEYAGTESVEACDLKGKPRERVTAAALGAWRALGLSGYGRVDMRLDPDGRPWVIDVNPNPDLSRDAGLALAASRAGLSHDQLVMGVLTGAMHARRH
jgi:D-alanine-D-alanine ligase